MGFPRPQFSSVVVSRTTQHAGASGANAGFPDCCRTPHQPGCPSNILMPINLAFCGIATFRPLLFEAIPELLEDRPSSGRLIRKFDLPIRRQQGVGVDAGVEPLDGLYPESFDLTFGVLG